MLYTQLHLPRICYSGVHAVIYQLAYRPIGPHVCVSISMNVAQYVRLYTRVRVIKLVQFA